MKTKIVINRKFAIGNVDDRLFGGFLEHLGRAIYSGIYEPGHPSADADGFRGDVLALVKDLDMPVTRYPGGNFVSGYDWKDGIGERAKRPVRPELAWFALEPNQIGVDEFTDWCVKAKTEPLMAVNLGTGDAKSAGELVEYCNFPGGTKWSDERRRNGHEAPYKIRTWCLGNEMDGPWQIGHKNAEDYGKLAREAGTIMKWVDPEIELVVCGSSSMGQPTFGEWDATVLDAAFEVADYISLHAYYGNTEGDYGKFFAAPDRMAHQIEAIVATCDYVSAKHKSMKRINLSFDEWNIWYHSHEATKAAPKWVEERPILEDVYTLADALTFGGLLMTLLNHADRVKIACLAQTVNVIAPVMTRRGGGAWKQTIYEPFRLVSQYGRGTVMRGIVEGPEYGVADWGKPVGVLMTSVVYREEAGEISLFAFNRSLTEEMDFEMEMEGFEPGRVIEAIELTGEDLGAVNEEGAERVKPKRLEGCRLEGGVLRGRFAPASWNLVRIGVVRG